MKSFFAAILSSTIAIQATAAIDPMPAMQAPLASKSLLLDIETVNESFLIAVGERGHILKSTDGVTWQQVDVPVNTTLTAITFVNVSKGWAVGHDSTILATNDGGNSWTIQQYFPEREKPLLDIVFKDENNGVALGAYGQFFRTADGGQTWKEEFHSEFLPEEDVEYLNELKMEDEEAYLDERGTILPHFNKMVLDGRTAYLVGELGLIAKSNDFGVVWEQLDSIYQGSFFDIDRTQQGNLLAVGLRGNVFRSLRNGTPWQHIDTDTTALINDIVLTDDDRIFLLGNSGMLLVSSDDGQRFMARPQPDGKALIAGAWYQNKLIAVSEDGIKTITITK
ncbi:WD40/YVTN/BNR-like repeat-containing protein [Thalassotalea euphylliae]|uniref:WD40/YVTN/BNR-like repeat-containing protein n=1 Tax=Thalassotalea euphylliae TaxID=1655234 RepID=UPI00362E80EC